MLNHHFPSYYTKILFQFKTNSIQNTSLKNLISQILTNKISLTDYFNNFFFLDEIKIKNIIFYIKCKNHSEVLCYYCTTFIIKIIPFSVIRLK